MKTTFKLIEKYCSETYPNFQLKDFCMESNTITVKGKTEFKGLSEPYYIDDFNEIHILDYITWLFNTQK